MSCPHAETTTLRWLYDASEPEHGAHVAACADCSAVVAIHEEVAWAVSPVAPVLARDGAVKTSGTPAHRPLRLALATAAVALAAAALLTLGPVQPDEPVDTDLALVDVTRTELLDSPLYGDVDRDLDAIDLELMDLSFEMNTL